jgi:glycosyltransferase involved in cell wall biosynthesis
MRVSVVIPCRNDGRLLPGLTTSLCRQTRPPDEIVVVDDGSDRDPASSWFLAMDRRVELRIITQPHLGAPAARNRGFRESTGELVFFCDADITPKENCIERFVEVINSGPYDLAYSKFAVTRGPGGPQTGVLGKPFDPETLAKGSFITGTHMWRRGAFPADGWDETLPRLQDWELMRRGLLRDERVPIFVDEVLFSSPSRPNGITMNSIGLRQARQMVMDRDNYGWRRPV